MPIIIGEKKEIGRFFDLPGIKDVSIQMTQISRAEHIQATENSAIYDYNKKTHKKEKDFDSLKLLDEIRNIVINHIVGYKGFIDSKTRKEIPYLKENIGKIIDVISDINIEDKETFEEKNALMWLFDKARDAKNFLNFDLEDELKN